MIQWWNSLDTFARVYAFIAIPSTLVLIVQTILLMIGLNDGDDGLDLTDNGITDTQAKPFAIGGGTYARHLKEGVAFGMMFPGEPELAHQANERIDVANYIKAARIYAYAIVALCA